MSELTLILERAQGGDPQAAEEMLPLVYEELRKLAAAKMAHEAPGLTLQPTALVHEAWLRLTSGDERRWANRAHFFHSAAEAMRRILIDKARARGSQKRGSDAEHLSLDQVDSIARADDTTLLRLDEALEKLSQENAESAKVVKVRFFVGLSVEDTAESLGISERTVKRHWAYARAWLFEEMRK